jgi:hypothetical protein
MSEAGSNERGLMRCSRVQVASALAEMWPLLSPAVHPRTSHAVLAAKMGLSLNLWCMMMSSDAWCPLMHDDVLWCMMMFSDAWWCPLMHDVLWCMNIPCDVWWWMPTLSANAHLSLLIVHGYSLIISQSLPQHLIFLPDTLRLHASYLKLCTSLSIIFQFLLMRL